MSMRRRINVSIKPIYYDELLRICKDYGFTTPCEICTALISVFINRVNHAESQGRKFESNEEHIKKMFDELENWEPTPQPDIMYKRHQRRRTDSEQKSGTHCPEDLETSAEELVENYNRHNTSGLKDG